MLIHETKFVIRQYYLVSSLSPLVIWMYKECYLKFSSQKYSLGAFHESVHFTNYAVQKKYQNSYNQHSEIPKYHMWNLNTYKKYLVNTGHAMFWDNLVYPSMKDTIIKTMLNSQDPSFCDPPTKCFGLYGCDFILDKDYTPWLIEINSCSNPKYTTEVTAEFYPKIVQDVLRGKKLLTLLTHVPNNFFEHFVLLYAQRTIVLTFVYYLILKNQGIFIILLLHLLILRRLH